MKKVLKMGKISNKSQIIEIIVKYLLVTRTLLSQNCQQVLKKMQQRSIKVKKMIKLKNQIKKPMNSKKILLIQKKY